MSKRITNEFMIYSINEIFVMGFEQAPAVFTDYY